MLSTVGTSARRSEIFVILASFAGFLLLMLKQIVQTFLMFAQGEWFDIGNEYPINKISNMLARCGVKVPEFMLRIFIILITTVLLRPGGSDFVLSRDR